ncbi:MAG TPA: phosphatase PAP2-related protein [Vicinamibacteria bacterium]|nr:phosphatase PAP2-related protein [Vicinamibacteria bacterium]
MPVWASRAVIVVVGLGGWFWTQALIARRAFPEGRIGDRLHDATASLHASLLAHPRAADRILVATSGIIDLLGFFLLFRAVFGPTLRPLVGLLLLFALRQACQAVCALPCPDGMIWRNPGFPSFLVTYGTASDLFFSGHTAIAVYGSLELAHSGGPAFAVLGGLIALIEATTVLVLRAHYTMDVYAGAVTALWVWTVASTVSPALDLWLASLAR